MQPFQKKEKKNPRKFELCWFVLYIWGCVDWIVCVNSVSYVSFHYELLVRGEETEKKRAFQPKQDFNHNQVK